MNLGVNYFFGFGAVSIIFLLIKLRFLQNRPLFKKDLCLQS